MTAAAYDAAKIIQHRCKNFVPKIAIILGSGTGTFAKQIENPVTIPYSDLSGFPIPAVQGHHGNLYLGTIQGVPIACLQGRAHYYEGANSYAMQTMVRTLKLLGCEIWLGTNASGSLRPKWGPGSLVLIKDHINFQFNHVLVGENDESFGPRFPDLQDAYDPNLRAQFFHLAKKLKIKLTEGVYVGVLGPAFETPAEIRAFRILGADLVGMSTIPEVIVARHCGMRVAVISVVSNLAAGIIHEAIRHDEAIHAVEMAGKNLIPLLTRFIRAC